MQRSHYVSELVKHLNALRDEVRVREGIDARSDMGKRILIEACWAYFTPDERRRVEAEIIRCRTDFRYLAGNYIWLYQPRSGRPGTLDLNDSQELLLETIEYMWRMGRPGWLLVHKARQLGCSTLALALAVWQAAFFTNRVCMMIAQDPYHSAYIFRAFQYNLFNLPYWMLPNVLAKEEKESMILGVQDESGYGGLNNYIVSFQANKMSAFAQGKAVNFLWCTEVSNFPEEKAERIIQGDLQEALISRPGCVGILESKPEGAAGFWYDLWHQYEKEGRRGAWYSAFIPCFFEKRRTVVVPERFKPNAEEIALRERYQLEWKKCSNPQCGATFYAGGIGVAECLRCGGTEGKGVVLTNEQLGWYRERKSRVKTKKQMRLFKQELATTAEEGFQVHGNPVFPDDVIQYIESTAINPRWVGEVRNDFSWHNRDPLPCPIHKGEKHCLECHEDHTEDEMSLQIWEFPASAPAWYGPRGTEADVYHIGIDAAYGLEQGDFGCISVLKQGKGMTQPDTQVAEYRGRVDAGELGTIAFIIGTLYNYARMAIEVMNGPGEKTQLSVIQKGYDHLWIWKHYDSTKLYTNRFGWVTNARTKPMLITNLIQWCRQKIVRFQSKEFLSEIKTFVKAVVYDESGGAARGKKDDSAMSNMINLFTFHDEHWNADQGRIVIPERTSGSLNPETPGDSQAKFWVTCLKGLHSIGVDNPSGWTCPECKKLDPNSKVYARSAFKTKIVSNQRRIAIGEYTEEELAVMAGMGQGDEQVEVTY